MCGRYEAFHVRANLDDVNLMPNDDITPGTMQPVVFSSEDGERKIELMYWGFTLPKRFPFNTSLESVLKPGLWKIRILFAGQSHSC